MDKLATLFGFLAVLSMATERITEVIKGFPLLSVLLVTERKPGAGEEARKAAIQILAIIIGTGLTVATKAQLTETFGLHVDGWACLVFGAMASGGSGLWNSALDIVREVNHQKQIITDQ